MHAGAAPQVLIRLPRAGIPSNVANRNPMKTFSHLAVAFVVTVALGGAFVAAQQAQRPSDEFRAQFIKDFKRIGLNTTEGDAAFLRILVASAGCKRGVEVGSATGFGAINMGIAFERNRGHLFTLDIDPKMIQATRDNVAAMGLERTVTAIEGDALKTLAQLEGEFDFVFLDAVKQDYLKYLQLIEPKLKPGAVVVADNVVRSERQMKDYLEYVQRSPKYDTVIIRASMEKNDGMAISYKLR
jgi:caffeoyl-CoA O-methyltransferase